MTPMPLVEHGGRRLLDPTELTLHPEPSASVARHVADTMEQYRSSQYATSSPHMVFASSTTAALSRIGRGGGGEFQESV